MPDPSPRPPPPRQGPRGGGAARGWWGAAATQGGGTYLGGSHPGGGPGRLLRGDSGQGQWGGAPRGRTPCPVVPTPQGRGWDRDSVLLPQVPPQGRQRPAGCSRWGLHPRGDVPQAAGPGRCPGVRACPGHRHPGTQLCRPAPLPGTTWARGSAHGRARAETGTLRAGSGSPLKKQEGC